MDEPVSESSEPKGKRIERVREILDALEKNLNPVDKDKSKRGTVADYVRLVQLERELQQDHRPAEIQASWIDPVSWSSDT